MLWLQLTELVKFLLVLAVFIVSFGVAFQAILHPNQSPSWTTLIDILWRPYWQMFGELFLDDVSTGMGLYPAHIVTSIQGRRQVKKMWGGHAWRARGAGA